ncbi:hypothetical protein ThidrDRAFT_4105 [Thiorhodococcus drewsii AZ1]|uniref:Uncharacterized protein n=1 Tax=Thiorhodococcus drewsii AZ1 TaxID=765913 RepID=G2E742_9GAMM|nr:hypothetical protein [Thiorhodococcus drewsii]EGV28073.1 hypothetical protein ThidrDRAFT_4105 [Thiorhodococcus drewsii AZ1]
MADAKSIPDDLKNLPEYPLDRAVKLWALVFRDIALYPTTEEQRQYQSAWREIARILRSTGKVQCKETSVTLPPPEPSPFDRRDECHRTRIQKTIREWITGPDFAALFAEKGRPGVIGFGDEPTPSVGQLDKPLREIERRTLLTIIEALAQHAKIDTTHHEAAGTTIAKLTDEIGAHVDSGTIARHLKKIPDAIEARTK